MIVVFGTSVSDRVSHITSFLTLVKLFIYCFKNNVKYLFKEVKCIVKCIDFNSFKITNKKR